MNRVLINIKGTVQGVGFRPFVYNLAKSMDLKGNVTNTTDGVAIDIEGEDVSSFIERISREAPPLSKINNIEVLSLPFCGYEDFEILKSSERGSFTLLSPDVSICDDCLREMLDRHDRRYLYPFINCINCGPRFTITGAIPYDRHNTTMSAFKMCPECEREYNDPADRRFHAQPNACPICGPRMEFKLTNKTISKAPSPSPSPAGGEGKNIAPPLRGGDKGEGDLCGFTNELLSDKYRGS
ncbi:MAG: carbamoyltransferase HypF [Nitrospirae bacterium]|nr:carbamoyltransferase HypF [Nitrospirota bacterium]